jgi:hypothetical protein
MIDLPGFFIDFYFSARASGGVHGGKVFSCTLTTAGFWIYRQGNRLRALKSVV